MHSCVGQARGTQFGLTVEEIVKHPRNRVLALIVHAVIEQAGVEHVGRLPRVPIVDARGEGVRDEEQGVGNRSGSFASDELELGANGGRVKVGLRSGVRCGQGRALWLTRTGDISREWPSLSGTM